MIHRQEADIHSRYYVGRRRRLCLWISLRSATGGEEQKCENRGKQETNFHAFEFHEKFDPHVKSFYSFSDPFEAKRRGLRSSAGVGLRS
jgi:hypothetical protein